MLASRAQSGPGQAGYIQRHVEGITMDLYNAAMNPEGYIPLSVAENCLSRELLPVYERPHVREAGNYVDPRGMLEFRQVLASYMAANLCSWPVEPEDLTVLAGGTSVLELTMYNLIDDGDIVMVIAPYFAGFKSIVEGRNCGKLFPISSDMANPDNTLRAENLQRHLERAQATGQRVQVILLSSPNNPMGCVYSGDALREMVEWATAANLHVVCDEAYGGSVFATGVKFDCIARHVSEQVHLIWTVSKDLGLSGVRLGVVYSKSRQLHGSLAKNGHQYESSVLVQKSMGRILSQEKEMVRYCDLNRANLRAAYDAVSSELIHQNIHFLEADAAFFILLDLREHMNGLSDEEMALAIADHANVGLAPGSSIGMKETGWFRICFTYNPVAETTLAICRLGNFLHSRSNGN